MVFTRSKNNPIKTHFTLAPSHLSMTWIKGKLEMVERRFHMTNNQIQFWNLEEQKRSNRAREFENTRSNRAREVENNRSNRARELEANRSNVASENIRRSELRQRSEHELRSDLEAQRSNLANEGIKAQSNSTNLLANLEQGRTNRANESIRTSELQNKNYATNLEYLKAMYSREIAGITNQTNIRAIDTQRRTAREQAELQRQRNEINRLGILQQAKNMQLNYQVQQQRNDISLQNLAEVERHNRTQEYISGFGTALSAGIKLAGGK